MKKLLSCLLVLLLLMPSTMALAEKLNIIVPSASYWKGINRTEFKKEHSDIEFKSISIGYHKGLLKTGFSYAGYKMDGYYEFEETKIDKYTLSRIIYLLDGKLTSSKKLNTCYKTIVEKMSKATQPSSSKDTKTVWKTKDYVLTVGIGVMKQYNKSADKTVYIKYEPRKSQKLTFIPPVLMDVRADATCSNTNNVGDYWILRFYVDGDEIPGRKWFTEGDTLKLKAVITEDDDVYPDIGTVTQKYTVTKKGTKEGFTVSFDVTVREDDGRFRGSKAVWHVTFQFSIAR